MMEKLLELVPGVPHFKHLKDVFEEGTPDNQWVPQFGKEGGWVVITSDNAKKSNRGGKLPALCIEHKVTHILFSKTLHQKTSAEKLAMLVSMWPQIAETHQEPAGTRFKLRLRERQDKLGHAVVLEKWQPPGAPKRRNRPRRPSNK